MALLSGFLSLLILYQQETLMSHRSLFQSFFQLTGRTRKLYMQSMQRILLQLLELLKNFSEGRVSSSFRSGYAHEAESDFMQHGIGFCYIAFLLAILHQLREYALFTTKLCHELTLFVNCSSVHLIRQDIDNMSLHKLRNADLTDFCQMYF